MSLRVAEVFPIMMLRGEKGDGEILRKGVLTKRDSALGAAHKCQSDTHYGNKIAGH